MPKKKINFIISIAVRYFILILLGLFNLKPIYSLFTPLTVYPVFWILSFIDNATTIFPGNLIFSQGVYFEIIRACVAGAAYYLLLILNLSTPMNWKKRVKSLTFIIIAFLLLNIIRIVIFASLFISGYKYFYSTHLITWYVGSTVLLVAVWFLNVLIFKIKPIPIYSDVMKIIKSVK